MRMSVQWKQKHIDIKHKCLHPASKVSLTIKCCHFNTVGCKVITMHLVCDCVLSLFLCFYKKISLHVSELVALIDWLMNSVASSIYTYTVLQNVKNRQKEIIEICRSVNKLCLKTTSFYQITTLRCMIYSHGFLQEATWN